MYSQDFLPRCSSLKELEKTLKEKSAQNFETLQKLAVRDDFESNLFRSRLLGENELITKILVAIQ